MMCRILSLTAMLFFFGCATTTPGVVVKTENKDFRVTMSKDANYSNKQIQMIRYSIQNNTDEWASFDQIDFAASEKVQVLLGDKMNAWFEACGLKERVSQYNVDVALGTVALVGATLAVAGGSKGNVGQANTGLILLGGSITASGIQSFSNAKKNAELLKAFPENHIFQPFLVPPRMVVQRWILVENSNDEKFAITLKQKNDHNLVVNWNATSPAK